MHQKENLKIEIYLSTIFDKIWPKSFIIYIAFGALFKQFDNMQYPVGNPVNTSYLCNTNSLLLQCFMYTRFVPIINSIKFICSKRKRENEKKHKRKEKIMEFASLLTSCLPMQHSPPSANIKAPASNCHSLPSYLQCI